jgi:hypothetical protein
MEEVGVSVAANTLAQWRARHALGRALPSDPKGTASLIRLTTPLSRSVQLARKEPTEVLRKNRLDYVELAVADQTCSRGTNLQDQHRLFLFSVILSYCGN